MATGSDYLPIATAAGNYADSQANFSGSGYQTLGFTAGTANPAQANKCWRQASMVGSALTNWMSNILNQYIYDDGNLAALITLIGSALTTFVNGLIAAAAAAVNSGSVTIAAGSLGQFSNTVQTFTIPTAVTAGQCLRFNLSGDPGTNIIITAWVVGTTLTVRLSNCAGLTATINGVTLYYKIS